MGSDYLLVGCRVPSRGVMIGPQMLQDQMEELNLTVPRVTHVKAFLYRVALTLIYECFKPVGAILDSRGTVVERLKARF